ncbi:DUF1552 domain-containing protein [Thiothrix sp.]|uniref:DUF1552 domain-containing protein n=1 Tax=Thiothrix sp. TaxID=1032 RepID=UPI00257D764D|nr:DUF1552 domain-containing protein [Thiothrix sp.]
MSMINDRRHFLKWVAAGIGAAALPFASMAYAGDAPRRAIFLHFPDGMRPEHWHAQGTGTNFILPRMTAPLERVRQHCVFLSGVDMLGSGSSHEGGVLKFLTGADGRGSDKAVSLDYYLAQAFKTQTIKPHLNLNIVPVWDSAGVTFDSNGLRVAPEPNPLVAFESLFGSNANNNFIAQRRLNAMSNSLNELNALLSKLGAVEKAKLDTHTESLRELEQKLNANVGACAAWNFNPTGFKVTRTGFWSNPEYRDQHQMGVISSLQMDVAVHALACDLTRVVTLTWGHSVNEAIIVGSGSGQTCHQASHGGGEDFIKIKAWYTEQLAKLIEQLASVPEGNGTLLDNTVIFVGSDLSNGGWHNHTDMPFIIAGGKNGGISGGRSLHFTATPHNKVLVSIAQFMGVNINSFGNQDSNPGVLPGLVG